MDGRTDEWMDGPTQYSWLGANDEKEEEVEEICAVASYLYSCIHIVRFS